MRHAVHQAALGFGEPVLHRARCSWPGACLADAENESYNHHRHKAHGVRGHHRHQRPEQHHDGEHLARTIGVGKPSAGNLAEGIGKPEGCKDRPKLCFAKAELSGDFWRCHGDIGAVDKGDEGHQTQHQEDDPTIAGSLCDFGGGRSASSRLHLIEHCHDCHPYSWLGQADGILQSGR